MSNKTGLTWGQLQELMKDADPALPIKLMIRQSHPTDEYHQAVALDAFVSEELAEGGQLVLVDELPFEPGLDTDYVYLKCSGCGDMIKEDAAGFARNNGKVHNSFWTIGRNACEGTLQPYTPKETPQ
jgi:hypothetical protein